MRQDHLQGGAVILRQTNLRVPSDLRRRPDGGSRQHRKSRRSKETVATGGFHFPVAWRRVGAGPTMENIPRAGGIELGIACTLDRHQSHDAKVLPVLLSLRQAENNEVISAEGLFLIRTTFTERQSMRLL